MYVMNVNTLAVTEYSLSALDVLEHQGEVYFVQADGLVKLVDPADVTDEAISCYVTTGAIHFGDKVHYKTVPRAFVYGSGDQNLTLTTITNERKGQQTREYNVRKIDTDFPIERLVKLARGVESVAWTFKVANTSNGTMKINDIKVLPKAGRVIR